MEDFSFGIGLKSNKESNDFLRCLWSRISHRFGKLAWLYSPLKVGNTIFVGQACISEEILLQVKLHYKQRGCLSTIDFDLRGYQDAGSLINQLKLCIKEALQYEKYLCENPFKALLDKNISFKKKDGRKFCIDGNEIVFYVQGFDEVDLQSICKVQMQQLCNFLTFDTLRYITSAGTLTEEIRNNHNLRTSLVNADTGEKMGVDERNERYRNLVVSDWMARCIDEYLERPYLYENHFSNFDKCIQLFAQAVRNEELSQIAIGLPEPYVEQAIVNYMSSLEVITLNDREPEPCESCGQMRYSIARRVIDLADSTFPGRDNFAKDYYKDRSKYVHTGALFSSNNYINRTIPIMSISSRTGMIDQIANVHNGLKELVKECIIKHEHINCER